jgi:hypothetical protein
MAHHTGFTRTTLAEAFYRAGFGSVFVLPRIRGFDLQVIATPAKIPQKLLVTLASAYFLL